MPLIISAYKSRETANKLESFRLANPVEQGEDKSEKLISNEEKEKLGAEKRKKKFVLKRRATSIMINLEEADNAEYMYYHPNNLDEEY